MESTANHRSHTGSPCKLRSKPYSCSQQCNRQALPWCCMEPLPDLLNTDCLHTELCCARWMLYTPVGSMPAACLLRYACRWLLTWDGVRSSTPISLRMPLGAALAGPPSWLTASTNELCSSGVHSRPVLAATQEARMEQCMVGPFAYGEGDEVHCKPQEPHRFPLQTSQQALQLFTAMQPASTALVCMHFSTPYLERRARPEC